MSDRRRITALCRWFTRHARPLPWRTARRNPYRSLVSEFMLQQTQVSRVINAYRLFIRRFPTVQSLERASEQQVLRLWQGLGYYRRARMLHQAAKAIVREHGGRVPRRTNLLIQLPGVGRYTAGAIASMVFNQPEPIVDGNVRRVLQRWGIPGRRTRATDNRSLDTWCWDRAKALVDLAPRPAVFNEAMMELGATICTPRNPRCGECPVATLCASRHAPIVRAGNGRSARKTLRRTEHHHALVLASKTGDRIAIEQRPNSGMWASLWQVPTIESTSKVNTNRLQTALRARGITLVRTPIRRCRSFKHNTTHKDITFHVYKACVLKTSLRMASPVALKSLPMSNAQRKVLAIALPVLKN